MSFIYRIFLKGLLTLLPITITLYLLIWIARTFESALGGLLRTWLPSELSFPGIGVILGLLLILFVGVLVNNYLTHQIFRWFEARLEAMPVVRSIYSPIKDVTQLFAKSDSAAGSQKVVLVRPYGPTGPESLGLVTRADFSEFDGSIAESSLAVFIPFSYAMGGMTVIVSRADVRETQIEPNKAMQLALTAWIKS